MELISGEVETRSGFWRSTGHLLKSRTLMAAAALAAALALGFALRLSSVRHVPFYEDDYATALQALGIMKTFRPTLLSGWVQWAEPLALPYAASWVWRFTPPDIMVGRLLSLTAGMLSILVAYVLGRRMRDEVLGAVFAFLISANLWSVASSTYFRSFGVAELGFLLICYMSVGWLTGRRSVGSYLAIIGTSAIVGLLGHYLLALVIPVSLSLPLIGRLSAARSRPGDPQPPRREKERRWRARRLVFPVAFGLVLGIGTWLVLQHGFLVARAIGGLTGEFFTRLPENPRITFHPFYVEALWKLYGPWLAVTVAGGAVMLVQTGGRGLVILLGFAIPFLVLSTLFASVSVTGMFDRYLFPFNPALLLMTSFFLTWLGDAVGRVGGWVTKRFWGPWLIFTGGALPLLLALVLVAAGDGFLLRLDRGGAAAAVEAWMRDRRELRTPSYHRAATYIRNHMAPADIVASTRPSTLPFEIPRARGYWLMSKSLELAEAGIRTPQGMVDRLSGYPVITDLGQLLTLLAEGYGAWVLLPYFHDSAETLSPGIWGFVHAHARLVPDASDDTLLVFRWKSGRFRVTALKQAPQPYGNAAGVARVRNGVTLLAAEPGPADWAGVQYRLPPAVDVRRTVFRLRVKPASSADRAGPVSFDFILEEADGDRWHLPRRLDVRPGDGWQEFFLPFSYLQFWPLGPNSPDPARVQFVKLEAVDARSRAFAAEVEIALVTIEPGD